MRQHRRLRSTDPSLGQKEYPTKQSRFRAYTSSRSRVRVNRGKKRALKAVRPLMSHPHPYVSVIIPVMNERRTIAKVIREARKVHAAAEVIVVANGTTDGSDRIAERAGARVIRHAEPLGHDVGRTVGAYAAKGEVLLFIDGDMVISAAQLRPFVHTITSGADVALNRYSGPTNKHQVHRVVLAKHVLNELLSRSDLRGMSMTAVPHALSRKALELIGPEHLSIPPLAHVIAIHKQLRLIPAHAIDVGRMNKRRVKEGAVDPLERLIDNDHLQSLRWMIEHTGPRGGYTDMDRQRQLVR
ncbi:glycosyltransferase family 2 protein [Paenibacillus marinisediminis]